jgi:hypothetical protein
LLTKNVPTRMVTSPAARQSPKKHEKGDHKIRSKGSQVHTRLNSKTRHEPLCNFISCWAVSTHAQCGLLGVLGEVARIPAQHLRSGETVAPNVALA